MEKKWSFTIKFLIALVIVSFLLAGLVKLFFVFEPIGNVALIRVRGTLVVGDAVDIFGGEYTDSDSIIDFIRRADQNPSVSVLLLDIESPGGSPVATMEIVDAIKRTRKPVYALIRSIGTSGAYWIASAADFIMANKLSLTGSIGVYASYLEFAELLKRYNITYRRLVVGELKDVGSPYKELSEEEKQFLLHKLKKIHRTFVSDVAKNRNLSIEAVEELATGEFFLGEEALENGLIDAVGTKEDMIDLIKREFGLEEVEFAEYEDRISFIEAFGGLLSRFVFLLRDKGLSGMTDRPTLKT